MANDLIAMLIVAVLFYFVSEAMFGGVYLHIARDEFGWRWWFSHED